MIVEYSVSVVALSFRYFLYWNWNRHHICIVMHKFNKNHRYWTWKQQWRNIFQKSQCKVKIKLKFRWYRKSNAKFSMLSSLSFYRVKTNAFDELHQKFDELVLLEFYGPIFIVMFTIIWLKIHNPLSYYVNVTPRCLSDLRALVLNEMVYWIWRGVWCFYSLKVSWIMKC